MGDKEDQMLGLKQISNYNFDDAAYISCII